MTVRELIAFLRELPPEDEVHFVSNETLPPGRPIREVHHWNGVYGEHYVGLE